MNKCLVALGLQNCAVDVVTLKEAIRWAQTHGAELHAVLVIPATQNEYVQTFVPESVSRKIEQEARHDLESFVAQFLPDDLNCETHVLHGKPYKAILGFADELEPQAMIIGAHKGGRFEFNMGSSASRITRHARCTVVVVRQPARD